MGTKHEPEEGGAFTLGAVCNFDASLVNYALIAAKYGPVCACASTNAGELHSTGYLPPWKKITLDATEFENAKRALELSLAERDHEDFSKRVIRNSVPSYLLYYVDYENFYYFCSFRKILPPFSRRSM